MMYSIGDKVRKKSNSGVIGEILSIDQQIGFPPMYAVDFGCGVEYLTENGIKPYQFPITVEYNLINNKFGSYHEFQKAFTFLKLRNSKSIQNNVYAMNTSKTEFFAYQYKPLIKFINSFRRRILICDEVGLGKTIEAGLILKELDARKELKSVLIVPPANLRVKWKTEMFNRFGEDFVLLQAKEFIELIEDGNTMSARYKKNRFIVSLESIRSRSVELALEASEVKWDFLIVDEAHGLRNKNKQHKAAKLLSDSSEAIVFLTATPVHIAKANLFNILSIMDDLQYNDLKSFERQLEENQPIVHALNTISRANPNLEAVRFLVQSVEGIFRDNPIYNDTRKMLDQGIVHGVSVSNIVDIQRNLSELHLIGPVYNRTLKRDVHYDRPIRVPHKIDVWFNEDEQAVYNSIISGIKEYFDEDQSGILAVCRAKQMLSSSLQAHLSKLRSNYHLTLSKLEEAYLFDETDDDVFVENLEESLEKSCERDSKFIALMKILDNARKYTKKVIIFAFFKDTLRYLYHQLYDKKVKCFMMHGNVSIDDRKAVIHNFQYCSEFCILLSSRVGSEGIDLQFCDTVVNYDMPWNPMELEQRIGRIDRIGQKSKKIHIYTIGMLSTIDDQIISRLYDRIALFEGTIGVMEPIMEDIMSGINRQLFYDDLSPSEMEERFAEQERILLNKMRDMKSMELASKELLSLDQYFDREIVNIQKNRRFLSPRQLNQYIAGHIDKNYPDSIIEYDASKQVGSITLCKQFRKDLRSVFPDEKELDIFSYGDSVSFTYSSNVALNNDSLQLFNVLHPLVQAITELYQEADQIENCHYFRIRESSFTENGVSFKPGYYFYFMCLGTVTTQRPTQILLPIILDEDLEVIGDSDFCEQVIGIAVEEGIPAIQNIHIDDEDYLKTAFSKAFSIFKQRFYNYFGHYKARHELILNRRKESKKFYWENRIQNVMRQIVAMDQDANKQILNMKNKQLINDQAKMKAELELIDHDQRCEPEFKLPEMGGIFEVF